MVLKETERTAIENLRTQEKSCVEKYQKYAQQAIDPELKNLFEQLHKKEQTHYDSLTQVLDGTVPSSDCNDSDGRNYEPRAIYTAASQSEDKMHPVNFLPVSFSFRTIKHDIRIAIKFPKPVMIPPFTPDVCATPI